MLLFQIEIYPGSGVMINAGELASIKLVSREPTITARNLFRRLFTEEELSTHSLFGKKCNANKDAVPLPRIDQIRSNAVLGMKKIRKPKFVLPKFLKVCIIY